MAAHVEQIWGRALSMLQTHRQQVPSLLGLCVTAAARATATPTQKAQEARILPAGLLKYVLKLREWVAGQIVKASTDRESYQLPPPHRAPVVVAPTESEAAQLRAQLAHTEQLWAKGLKLLQCNRQNVPTLLGLCVIKVARMPGTTSQKRSEARMLPAGLQKYVLKLREYISERSGLAAMVTGPLGQLSHDAIGLIFTCLADPLQPAGAVALRSTCKGLRTPELAGESCARSVLKRQHAEVKRLCREMGLSCAGLHDVKTLRRHLPSATVDDMATFGMILRTNGLPMLQQLLLHDNNLGDADVQALCKGVGRGAAPSLTKLTLCDNEIGPTGAQALAAAFGRGAMPRLASLSLDSDPIDNQGIAALAAPLRKLPSLTELRLSGCWIADEGVASLVANIGKGDYKALKKLHLEFNALTDAGCATLVRVLKAGAFPALETLDVSDNPADETALGAVGIELRRAQARRRRRRPRR